MGYSLGLLQKFALFLSYILCLMSLQGVYDFGTTHLIVFGIWLIITLLSFNNELSCILKSKRFQALLFFLIYYLITSTLSESLTVGINRCVAFMSTASPILMYEIMRDRSTEYKWFFLLTILLVFAINVVLSYSFLEIMGENNLRQGHEVYGPQYFIINITFDMCYAFAILIPCLIDIFKSLKELKINWLKRYLLLALAAVMLVFLIREQFVTAILISLIGGLIAWFYKPGAKNIVIVCVAFALVSFLFIQIYPTIRSTYNFDEFLDITYRLDEVYNTMTGNKHEAEDFNSRQALSVMSLETFLEHPIFGKNPTMIPGVHPSLQGIGNHATWVDSLALYGLFAFFYFVFLWDSLKIQRRYIGKVLPTIMFIGLGFMNPLWFFPQIVSAFLIAPLMYDLLNNKTF